MHLLVAIVPHRRFSEFEFKFCFPVLGHRFQNVEGQLLGSTLSRACVISYLSALGRLWRYIQKSITAKLLILRPCDCLL